MAGVRHEGHAALRRRYAHEFATFPDGRCEMRSLTSHAGGGMAESRFLGTHARSGRSVRAAGAEGIEFADGEIKEIRDDHRLTAARDEP